MWIQIFESWVWMPWTGRCNSKHIYLSFWWFLWHTNSKKSRIQSQNLAAAILEGLMPIGTGPEPEDVDDEVPSRVCMVQQYFTRLTESYYRLPYALLILSRRVSLQARFSLPSGTLSCSTCKIPILLTVDVRWWRLASASKAVASSWLLIWARLDKCEQHVDWMLTKLVGRSGLSLKPVYRTSTQLSKKLLAIPLVASVNG